LLKGRRDDARSACLTRPIGWRGAARWGVCGFMEWLWPRHRERLPACWSLCAS